MPSYVEADLLVARLAAEGWGVLSRAELAACGLSPKAVAVRVERGQLHPLHRGVYAVGHARPPLEGRWLAAVKACGPRAVLSHFSAAALWGFIDWEERRPEVTVPAARVRCHPAIAVHRSETLDAPDVMRHRGIPVTSPARTLLDLAATLDDRRLRAATRRAQGLYRVNVRQLSEVRARARSRRGARRLGDVIATGPAPTRSVLEDVVLDLILGAGFEHPIVNGRMVLAGRPVYPDFRWPSRHLVLEADGGAWHENELAREDDAERQALLEAHGERVIRVSWRQAVARPAQTIARLTAAGVPPRAR